MHLRSLRKRVKRFINVKPLGQEKEGLKNNNKRRVKMKRKWRCLIPLWGYYYIMGEGTDPRALRSWEALAFISWQTACWWVPVCGHFAFHWF